MTPVSLVASGLALRAGGDSRGRVLFTALDLSVEAGERWVVIGPNGAGKSSLLAALAGVFPLAAGIVCIDGRALAAWPPAALAERRAWSPQFWSDPFPSTVAETASLAHRRNVGWGASLGRARKPDEGPKADGASDGRMDGDIDGAVARVLARLGLSALARVDVQSLSGGERQRVAIATAFLQEAPLLLLDEPASHLDPAHQRLLLTALREHAEDGGTVIASLHDLDLAWDLASHCVLLDGRGGALAGRRDDVLEAARLSAVFGVTIEAVDMHGTRRFVVVDGAAANGRGPGRDSS